MSRILKLDLQVFRTIVEDSFSFNEILMKLNYSNKTMGYKVVKQRIIDENIDISHFKKRNPKKTDIKDYLIKDSRLDSYIKKKLIDEILGPKCVECGCGKIWNNKKLILQIDHINGCPSDNRLENLRVLCPNCHSQTDNFGSKNAKFNKKPIATCVDCSQPCSRNNKTGRCKNCSYRNRSLKPKVQIEDFVHLIGVIPIKTIAENFKVSVKTIKKVCSDSNTSYPDHMFWARTESSRLKSHTNNYNKPCFENRKYDYEKIYQSYLKTKNYSLTGKEFNLDRGSVRLIVMRHIRFMSQN